MDDAEVDRLTVLARAGDRNAMSRLLAGLMPKLLVVARREARGVLEAEDLQAHAIEKLLEVWADGRGPETDVFPYLVRTMRNRVIDEARSPRSQTRNLYETEDFKSAHEDPSESSELDHEKRWVKGGLRRLPPDQQRLMVGIYAEGRKPAELAEELGRSPNAVYSLHRRTKLALRRAILQEALLEGASGPCRAAAEDLPDKVDNNIEKMDDASRGMSHIVTCGRCTRAWRRFGSIGSTLGVGGMMALALDTPPHAAAAELDEWNDAGQPDPGLGDADVQQPREPASRSVRGADPPSEPLIAETQMPTKSRWRSATVGMIAAGVAGVALGFFLCHRIEPIDKAPAGSLAMSLENRDGIRAHIRFDIASSEWSQQSFTLSYPIDLSLVTQPDGWECEPAEGILRCSDPGQRPVEGTFEFAGEAALGDEFRTVVEATSGAYEFWGNATSEVPTSGDAVTTRAEVIGEK